MCRVNYGVAKCLTEPNHPVFMGVMESKSGEKAIGSTPVSCICMTDMHLTECAKAGNMDTKTR